MTNYFASGVPPYNWIGPYLAVRTPPTNVDFIKGGTMRSTWTNIGGQTRYTPNYLPLFPLEVFDIFGQDVSVGARSWYPAHGWDYTGTPALYWATTFGTASLPPISPVQSLLLNYHYDEVVAYGSPLDTVNQYIAEQYPIQIELLFPNATGFDKTVIQQPMSYLYRAHRISVTGPTTQLNNPWPSGQGMIYTPPYQAADIIKQIMDYYEGMHDSPATNTDNMYWPAPLIIPRVQNAIFSHPDDSAGGFFTNGYTFRGSKGAGLPVPAFPESINLQLANLVDLRTAWPDMDEVRAKTAGYPSETGIPTDILPLINNPDLYARNFLAQQEIHAEGTINMKGVPGSNPTFSPTTQTMKVKSKAISGDILFTTKRQHFPDYVPTIDSAFAATVDTTYGNGIFPSKDINITVTLNSTNINVTSAVSGLYTDGPFSSTNPAWEHLNSLIYWCPHVWVLPYWKFNNGSLLGSLIPLSLNNAGTAKYDLLRNSGFGVSTSPNMVSSGSAENMILPASGLLLHPSSGNTVDITIPEHFITFSATNSQRLSVARDVTFGIRIFGQYYLNFDIERWNYDLFTGTRALNTLSFASGIHQELPDIDIDVAIDGIAIPETAIDQHVKTLYPAVDGFFFTAARWWILGNDPAHL